MEYRKMTGLHDSEEHLKKQAKEDPESLFRDIEKSEDHCYLTYAVEYLGHVDKEYRDRALELLERFLDKYNSDTDPKHFIVREGVIYGLLALHWLSDSDGSNEENPELILFWERISQIISFYTYHSNEKSWAVRASAIDTMMLL